MKFDQISNKDTKQTCFDHNFSKSAPFGLRFAMVTQFEAFLKMQSIADGPEQFGGANKENEFCWICFFLEG